MTQRISLWAGILAALLFFTTSCMEDVDRVEIENDIESAREAFYYLNDVRQNPAAYSAEIGVDLSGVEASRRLKWNDKLAEAALHKVKSMAKSGSFSDNFYPDGDTKLGDKIKEFGYDYAVYSSAFGWHYNSATQFLNASLKEHSSHHPLLALTNDSKKYKDIGVAFIRVSGADRPETYCFIIASITKTEWDASNGLNDDPNGNTDSGPGGDG